MNKKMLIYLMLFLSCFAASPAYALNLLGLSGNEDFVANELDKWFNPEFKNAIGALLEVYMPILLQVGGIIAVYTLIIGTLSTAHDGEMMGKKWSAMWIPIRAPLAVAALFPVSNGYAVIQIIVLWLVIQGNQFGNDAWRAAAPRLITDNTYISVDNKVAIRELVVNTLYSAACVEAYNDFTTKHINDSNIFGFAPSIRYMDVSSFTSDSGSNKMVGYNFGYPDGNSLLGYRSDMCGSTKLKLINEDNLPSSGSMLIDTVLISKAVQEAQVKANAALVAGARAYAKSYLKNPSPADAKTINKHIDMMVAAYGQVVQVAAQSVMKSALSKDEVDKLTEKGWTYSYAFYNRIANAMSEANASVNRFPITSTALDERHFLGMEQVYAQLQKIQAVLKETDKLNSNMSDSSSNDDGWYQKMISTVGGNMGFFNSREESDTSSLMPLTVSVNLGQKIILSVEASYAALTLGSLLTGIPLLGPALQGAITIASPLLQNIMSPLLVAGSFLAFVIPMMPYIIGTMAVAGYFVLIIEAIFGAPLLAVATLVPDQDGIVGKQGQGYMLLLNLLLRPTLNVAGIVASYVMMTITFNYINSTFFAAASDTQGGLLGIQKGLTMIVIYMSVMLTTALTCLKLVNALPDTIFKWIGGATSSVLGMFASHADTALMKMQGAAAQTSTLTSALQGAKDKTPPAVPSSGRGKDLTASEGSKGNDEPNSTPSSEEPKGDNGVDIQDIK